MRNVSDKRRTEEQLQILYSITFFRKLRRLSDNVEKYCRAGQDTDGNTAHAL
jgi:hypothetical protein